MFLKLFNILFLCILMTGNLFAAEEGLSSIRQFSSNATLGGAIPVAVIIVADESRGDAANLAISNAVSHINSLYEELFSAGGVQEKINSLGMGRALKLSPEIFSFIKKSVDLALLTNGWFDITAPSPSGLFTQRDWRRVVLDESSQTISFKSGKMLVDLKPIAPAFFADTVMNDLVMAGFSNVSTKIEPVKRFSGHDIFTPWNLDIDLGQGPEKLAKRIQQFNVRSAGIATIGKTNEGQNLIDPHSKKPVKNPETQSVTVFAPDAQTALAYAFCAFTLGPKAGLNFIISHPDAKVIFIDTSGNLITSKELLGL